MNKKSLIFLFLTIFILTLFSNTVFAEDIGAINETDNLIAEDLKIDISAAEKVDTIADSQIASESSDIHYVDGSAYNQMNNPTLQDAIDRANPGDTIIVTGEEYVHCHFIVDKKLNIISEVGTTMTPCTSDTSGSGSIGIFYFTEEASGSLISGFNLINNLERDNQYSIFINGADNLTITNCTLENSNGPGVKVIGSNDITIANSTIQNSIIGVQITDSNNVNIINNLIKSNHDSGIHINTGVNNTYIGDNVITENNYNGIKFSSAVNSEIRNNKITNNRNAATQNEASAGNGIYVDCNITNMVIKGNLIQENGENGVCNSPNVKNLVDQYVQIINNNFFIAHNNRGAVTYNEFGTAPVYVWSNYYVLESFCGATYYAPGEYKSTGVKDLILGDVVLVENGVYSVSFVVSGTGEVAKELNSIELTFFLNKDDSYPLPDENDQYKIAPVINGTATVDISDLEFLSTGNVLTVIGPGYGSIVTSGTPNRPQAIVNIPDENIPSTTSTNLEGEDLIKDYGESGAYEVLLTDKNGNPIAGADIQISVNGATYLRTTDENGIARLNINLPPGTYSISAKFNGNEEYGVSSTENTIIVNDASQEKIGTSLEGNDLIKEFGSSDAFTVVLKDIHGNLIVNQNVEITVNGVTYTRTTDENGIARLNINLGVGVYSVSAKYSGNNIYSSSNEITKTVTVTRQSDNRLTTTIDSENLNVIYGENTGFIITLHDEKNYTLSNQNIELIINGVSYSKVTDNNGQAKLTIRLQPGTYNIQINYGGNSLYQPSSTSNIVVVSESSEEIGTTLITEDYTAYYGENKIFKATLTDDEGNPLANQYIQFTVNGVTYERTTDENGQAGLTIRLNEGSYSITSQYLGHGIYTGSNAATNKVIISTGNKTYDVIIESDDFTQAYGENKAYTVTLIDENGNPLVNQDVKITINGVSYTRTTDENGEAKLTIRLNPGIYTLTSQYLGNNLYNPSEIVENTVIVGDIVFVNKGLDNSAIQEIINNAKDNSAIKFGNYNYTEISLVIDKPLILIGGESTTLTGKNNETVLTLTENADGTIIQNLHILANEGCGIALDSSDNLLIKDNIIDNILDETLIDNYTIGDIKNPGKAIEIKNSDNVEIYGNEISNFEHGIYLENTDGTTINSNIIYSTNYGITSGSDVINTLIMNNWINNTIGLTILTVPEGPYGYAIYIKDSGVNVEIINNFLVNNYIGIFVDSQNSSGIVIKSNTITQSALEGITFNKNYTPAENATLIVEDNAIYNNAKGPSMMILGEVSANPEGIYGPGEWDDTLKLTLGSNWYGTNTYVTWGENSTGPGTICPRIKTTLITFNITYSGNNEYNIIFYKNNSPASDLAPLKLYITLNFNPANPEESKEVYVLVKNGVGTFSFNDEDYKEEGNFIYISCGSLYDENRIYQVIESYNITDNQITV